MTPALRSLEGDAWSGDWRQRRPVLSRDSYAPAATGRRGARTRTLAIASDDRDSGICVWNDDCRARHCRSHDVSHQNGEPLASGRSQPRGTCATKRMTPPHSEQGGGSTPMPLSGPLRRRFFPSVRSRPGFVGQQRATKCQPLRRWPLARKPKCRMRWKPSGKTWRRKRRMNSSGVNRMSLRRRRWR